jgi:hypothetical protein
MKKTKHIVFETSKSANAWLLKHCVCYSLYSNREIDGEICYVKHYQTPQIYDIQNVRYNIQCNVYKAKKDDVWVSEYIQTMKIVNNIAFHFKALKFGTTIIRKSLWFEKDIQNVIDLQILE